MSAEVLIRPAAEGDLEALAVLSGELGYPVSPAELLPRLQAVLARGDHRLLVAQVAEGVVGWAHGLMRYMLEEPPHAFVGGLIVKEEHRSQHVGEKLMQALEAWAHSLGASEVHVYSNIVRERAHRFYQRIGYEHFKVSKVFRKKV